MEQVAKRQPNEVFERLRRETTGAAAGEGGSEYIIARDGTRLFLRSWTPAGGARRAALCFHGATGSGEFFAMFADILAPRGAAVFVADYRGHGLSGGRRGDYPSFETLLEDAREIAALVRARTGGAPLFVLGESMGGAVAVNFAARFPDLPAGLILFSPALLFRKSVPWPHILFMPYYLLMALTAPGRPVIGVAGRENEGIKNPLHAEYDRTDPLHLSAISARYFLQLNRYMGVALKECPPLIFTPTILFQGEADAGIDPAGARDFIARLASADKQLVLYPKGYHTLLTDPDAPDVAARLAEWVEKH